MKVFENYSLLSHNTMGIDARCLRFAEYETIDELRALLAELRRTPDSRYLHIGAGSNLLFTGDYAGTILHSAIKGRTVLENDETMVRLRVGAGETWDDVVAWCVAQGYYGLENLSYIPGEVGAAAVQNIGAYGKEAGDFIERVETVSVETGEERVFLAEECRYAYRYSVFKGEMRGKYVVTAVVFRLSRIFQPDLSYGALQRELDRRALSASTLTASMLRQLIVEIRRSKLPEPAELGSAGSFFMNPVVERELAERLLAAYPDMPHFPVGGQVKIPAGWLIEHCGWKGRRVGRVGVYEKQALVLVNHGGATGEEMCRLSESIRQDVKCKFGISIFPEVNFI